MTIKEWANNISNCTDCNERLCDEHFRQRYSVPVECKYRDKLCQTGVERTILAMQEELISLKKRWYKND